MERLGSRDIDIGPQVERTGSERIKSLDDKRVIPYADASLDMTENIRSQTAAVIPAYQDEKHIGDIARRTRERLDHVLVVDDGSTDLGDPSGFGWSTSSRRDRSIFASSRLSETPHVFYWQPHGGRCPHAVGAARREPLYEQSD